MTHSDTAVTPREPNALNLTTKLAYGVGDLGTAVSAGILVFYQLIFLTNVAGLSPVLAGSIRTVAGIWDAVNDPIVGTLSDRTRTRWGRRYPWIVMGAIPLGFFFFLSWIVPQFSTESAAQQRALFWFYVGVSVLFNTAYTAVNLPYTALTPELTRDYNERTSLNQFRFTFSIGGSILSLVLAQVIFSTVTNPREQYLLLGGVCALFCVLPPYLCVLGTRKRVAEVSQFNAHDSDAPAQPYLQQLKIVFSNRPFLFVIGIYLFSWLAVQNTAAIIPFFIKDWMKLPPQHYAQLPLALQGTAIVMLSVWGAISRRVGKKAVYFMGMTIWIVAEVGIFMLQPGQVGLMYFLAVLAGCGVSTAYLIPWSMIPDVIELDELKTGQRREGIFYGFMVFLQKIGLAIGQLLVGFALQWAGFQSASPNQPTSALFAIRLLMGPIPAIALILGLVLAYFYPITREVHAEILLQLKQRREQEQHREQA
jgi:glycoside/pentoside/hexuronide:cation symporter, GPH family